jgi:hypothetical protein
VKLAETCGDLGSMPEYRAETVVAENIRSNKQGRIIAGVGIEYECS